MLVLPQEVNFLWFYTTCTVGTRDCRQSSNGFLILYHAIVWAQQCVYAGSFNYAGNSFVSIDFIDFVCGGGGPFLFIAVVPRIQVCMCKVEVNVANHVSLLLLLIRLSL